MRLGHVEWPEKDTRVDERCIKHTFEEAVGRCRFCHHGFCTNCLVYPFGLKKPPYCVDCAIAAAGVRLTAANRPTEAASPGTAPGRHKSGWAARRDAKRSRRA